MPRDWRAMGWISQADVARSCGVSVMTVSRALRGQRGVDPRVRETIQRAARRLGYRPDPMLSALVAHRMARRPRSDFSVIAFVTSGEPSPSWRSDHVLVQTFEGAARRGLEMGFSLQEFCAPDYARRKLNLSRVLVNRGIRGLMLTPLPRLDAQPQLDWDKFSVVAIGYTISHPGFSFVASHHSRSLSQILEETARLGYRRPALVFNPWADERSLHQLSGSWYYEMHRRPAKDRVPIWHTEERPAPEQVRKWIVQHKPDLVIDTFSPDEPILRGTGLQTPGEIGYVSTNLRSADGEISGIFQNFTAMGASAIDRLSILINKGETGAPQIREGSITFGTWCQGRTVRPLH